MHTHTFRFNSHFPGKSGQCPILCSLILNLHYPYPDVLLSLSSNFLYRIAVISDIVIRNIMLRGAKFLTKY